MQALQREKRLLKKISMAPATPILRPAYCACRHYGRSTHIIAANALSHALNGQSIYLVLLGPMLT